MSHSNSFSTIFKPIPRLPPVIITNFSGCLNNSENSKEKNQFNLSIVYL